MKNASLKLRIMTTTIALAVVGAVVWLTAIDREFDSQAMLLPDQVITVFSEPKPLTAFTLMDHKNRAFNLASVKGKWSFLFFGYTYCPDVCPTTMAVLARVREYIARNMANATNIQFIFVSVDPNRDTSARLAQYVGYFDSSFLGVSGEEAQIANLAAQLNATYQVTITPGKDSYPVYHTPGVFLLDPQARYNAVFTPPHDAEVIGKRFQALWEIEGGNAT